MLQITEEGRALIRAALGSSLYNRGGPAPVTLSGKFRPLRIKRPKLNRERFARLVGNAMLIMETWQASKFEFEGVCRNGIRSQLCLEGWQWHFANLAAEEVVGEALRRMGAERPNSAEAQIDFAMETPIDRIHCARCGFHIPDERRENSERLGRSVKYCSDTCATCATIARKRAFGEQQSMAEWLAACSVKSQRRMEELARNCQSCGTRFLPRDRSRKFCSSTCSVQSTTKRQNVRCAGCGTTFMQRKPSQTVCSRECGAEAQRQAWAAKRRFQCEEISR